MECLWWASDVGKKKGNSLSRILCLHSSAMPSLIDGLSVGFFGRGGSHEVEGGKIAPSLRAFVGDKIGRPKISRKVILSREDGKDARGHMISKESKVKIGIVNPGVNLFWDFLSLMCSPISTWFVAKLV